MKDNKILREFDYLRKQTKKQAYGDDTGKVISNVYSESLEFLNKAIKQNLKSKVEGKEFFSYSYSGKSSRAINVQLFKPDFPQWELLCKALNDGHVINTSKDQINKIIYSLAISFCASIDLIKSGDQKTPGTFFEYLIAFFVAWRTGVQPQNHIPLPNYEGKPTNLPTDLIFDLGTGKAKFHIPVKTSSRERSIMLWAHQRLLDGIYGTGRFIGAPVLLAENKTNKTSKEVVEICLPEQWLVYQMHIAKLARIYYLDPPQAYLNLSDRGSSLVVKPFSEFFFEWSELAGTK